MKKHKKKKKTVYLQIGVDKIGLPQKVKQDNSYLPHRIIDSFPRIFK